MFVQVPGLYEQKHTRHHGFTNHLSRELDQWNYWWRRVRLVPCYICSGSPNIFDETHSEETRLSVIKMNPIRLTYNLRDWCSVSSKMYDMYDEQDIWEAGNQVFVSFCELIECRVEWLWMILQVESEAMSSAQSWLTSSLPFESVGSDTCQDSWAEQQSRSWWWNEGGSKQNLACGNMTVEIVSRTDRELEIYWWKCQRLVNETATGLGVESTATLIRKPCSSLSFAPPAIPHLLTLLSVLLVRFDRIASWTWRIKSVSSRVNPSTYQ